MSESHSKRETMTFHSRFHFGDMVRHRWFPAVIGAVEEVSFDSAGVEWVKLLRETDGNGLESQWLRQGDVELIS